GDEPRLDISIPGGGNEIPVTGRRDRNVVRASDQVVSILSSEEVARTGGGDLAVAPGRGAGRGGVGSGFVYVRGPRARCSRDLPPALEAFFASGKRISSGNVDTSGIAGQLVNSRNAVLQRWDNLPPNFSGSISGGKTFAVGESDLGVIATASYSNGFTTRDALQQTSLTADLSQVENDFQRITTDQRMVLNGMLGFGLEFGDHTVRWTNLYIHD